MHIVIVEDEPVIRQELAQLLRNSLYEVTTLERFTDVDIVGGIIRLMPDLVLLDVNLPGESGFDICQSLRRTTDVPVIFVTSRTDSMDELNGMLRGGDDYITKPFNPPVLLAHIAAVLKRAKRNVSESDEAVRLSCRGMELDVAGGFVCYQGKRIDLSKNELKILYYLFRHQGKIVPRMDLVEYLWDNQLFIDDNALSVNVTRLRGKLEEIGVRDFIETKRGMGYRV